MIVYKDQCFCLPGDTRCMTVECPRHWDRIKQYQKDTELSDQLPVSAVDFTTTCEAYTPGVKVTLEGLWNKSLS